MTIINMVIYTNVQNILSWDQSLIKCHGIHAKNIIHIKYHNIQNIFSKMNDETLIKCEYDIIGYLIQHDLHFDTFPMTQKEQFINNLLIGLTGL